MRGCETHGLADFRVYRYANGRVEKRCLACQRERTAAFHYNGPRCRKGHLKTPWNWRLYSGLWRCMACHKIVRAAYYRRKKVA